MDVVNEKTSCIVTASFLDENELAVTPDSFTYRIDDVLSGTAIVGITVIVPGATTYDIAVTSTQNRIINSRKDLETRLVTVEFNYSGRHGTAEYRYQVKNLKEIS